MSTSGAAPGGLSRDLKIGLIVLGLAPLLLVLIVIGVRYWTDDSPRTALAGSAVASSPPVPLSAGQTFVRTEVLGSGELVVTQWINSEEPLDNVLLSPSRLAATRRVVADQVRVVADGTTVTGAEQISGQPQSYSFEDASSVLVTYRLTGSVERSGSAPGRALARMTALDVSYEPASVRVIRSILASEVLSLACAAPEDPSSETPCGTRVADGEWTVELEGDRADDRVIAQVTLD